jgi:hypothetical protein
VHHKGSAAIARATRRATKAVGRAFVGFQIYTTARDALQAAGVLQPDYHIEHADYYFTADDGSVFIIENPTWRKGAKQVFVAGPRAGQTIALTDEQYQQYKAAAEKIWGRYDPGSLIREPRFYPGEKRKRLPYYEDRDGYPWEAGWIDEDGIHRYTRPRPPEA